MGNPYKDLPDQQFWRRAITDVERFRFDPVVSTRFRIGASQKVATAGSCFAQHISNRLSRLGFNYYITERGEHADPNERAILNYGVYSARYGNIYTSRQLLQLFQECFDGRTIADGVWQRRDGRYIDALRPQIAPAGFQSESEVGRARAQHITYVREMFENCDIFIFTLGLTEAWQSRVDRTVYPLAPGVAGGSYDPERHEFINLDIHEVMQDMELFIKGLKSINPNVKIVLSVSPVPLVATYENRNVLVSTTYSKSVLRVAADMLYRKHPDFIEYFPSYEIITGNYTNSAYFESNYREVNSIGVDHAMSCFLKHYTERSPGMHALALTRDSQSAAAFDVVCDEEALDQIRV